MLSYCFKVVCGEKFYILVPETDNNNKVCKSS